MRKRDRERAAEVARVRLERLNAELAGIRAPLGPAGPGQSGATPGDGSGPVGQGVGSPPAGLPGGLLSAARVPTGDELGHPARPVGWRALGARSELADRHDLEPFETVHSGPSAADPEPVPRSEAGSDPARVPMPGRHLAHRGDGRLTGWAGDRLPAGLRGRVGLGSQHLGVVLALIGAALAAVGWLAIRSGVHEQEVPSAGLVASTALPSLSATGATSPPTSPPTSLSTAPSTGTAGAPAGGSVVVDVAGKVRHPGIVTLPAGSRVHDAIAKAGGARRGVALTSINLARPLVDGEQILVGRPPPAGTAPAVVGSTPAGGAMVHLNTAGLTELDTLPGVGPVTAQKILDWRSAHGAFNSVDELLEVDGIGDKTLADIAPHVTL